MLDPQYIVEDEELEQPTSDTATGRVLRLHEERARRQARRESHRARRARSASKEVRSSSEVEAAVSSMRGLRRRGGPLYRASSWLSVRLAPLCGAFYDAQMQIGKGVRVVSHRLQLPGFPSGAPPLKVVFLSDLHYGPTSGRAALKQAWKLVREQNPDLVLLGGDYLFADERGLPALLMELQRFQHAVPRAGIFACLGNHDYFAGRETIQTCLEACGVRVLVNSALPLPTPWKGVWIAGVDDLQNGEPDLDRALSGVSPDACTLLLSHEPAVCAQNATRRCAVTFSGHTHGGQICLPNGDPLFPSRQGREYPAGLFRHAGQWLFVSRGVGTVVFPMRLFCPPEVAVFEFVGRTTTRPATSATSAARPLVAVR